MIELRLLTSLAAKGCVVENRMITVVIVILVTNLRIVIHQTVQLTLLVQLLLELKEVLLLLDRCQFAEVDLVSLQFDCPVFIVIRAWQVKDEVLDD